MRLEMPGGAALGPLLPPPGRLRTPPGAGLGLKITPVCSRTKCFCVNYYLSVGDLTVRQLRGTRAVSNFHVKYLSLAWAPSVRIFPRKYYF